nr:MAG TPA: tail component [Caudoviricetes sp.]
MSTARMVYQALSHSRELTQLLAHGRKGIYHGRSADAGTYPILVYSVISDVPALSVDGAELERRITVRVHILTKDGRFREIHRAVQNVLLPLGFVRVQTQELTEKDMFVEITDYKTVVEGE